MDDRFDAIVVGAGPAGIAAAREMAEAGLSVVVLERGQYPGAKNVSGGILYRQPTEEIIPGFESEAPLERPIIEQRYLALTGDAMLAGGGGGNLEDFAPTPAFFSAKVYPDHHYVTMEIIGDVLTMRMHGLDGNIRDVYSIEKGVRTDALRVVREPTVSP